MIKVNYGNAFMVREEVEAHRNEVLEAHKKLHEKTGEGSDFLGWVDLKLDEQEFKRVKNAATWIRENSDVLVVIGIGGSYLGARAVIEALSNNFGERRVLFAGNNLNSDYLSDLLEYIENKNVCLNVISKSGTTIEPAIAFKVLREFMENKYGEEESRKRIFVTTDKEKGVLKEIANQKGYETFIVPDDIGGRYSVFTPVGLLPIAAAGIDIDKLLEGVYEAKQNYQVLDFNPCYEYAVARTILYRQGKKIEILANYEPKLHYVTEWWKQLYGESEGKEYKGLFPAGVDYTTDLHSMGQYVQEGERHLFETVINIKNPYRNITFNCEENAMDKLGYLNGKTMAEANRCALEGTIIAHTSGYVPNIILEIERLDEKTIGELLYFFEKACGISGYMLGVNPFNQPGVEAYKKEMFRLLGKK